jgi:hypothetical protein
MINPKPSPTLNLKCNISIYRVRLIKIMYVCSTTSRIQPHFRFLMINTKSRVSNARAALVILLPNDLD